MLNFQIFLRDQEQEEKPDYAEQASAELDKILSKATMLIEMLNEVKPGEIIGRGDIFEVQPGSRR